MPEGDNRKDGVSPEQDELSSTLVGEALDVLAEGGALDVLLVVQDQAGTVASYAFSEDGIEACLKGAHDKVVSLGRRGGPNGRQVVRYALAYEGAVADEVGAYRDALICEFGERGYKSYSAFSLFEGRGRGDQFTWSDPAPAGELHPLL